MPFAVVELAEQQHQSRREKTDVCGGKDNFRSRASRGKTQFVHEVSWIFQVFDDVEKENLVELGHVYWEFAAVEVEILANKTIEVGPPRYL